MKRTGFTMIELIFVIVILGILAAVAIPKLAATRDDAKIAKMATNIATLISDVGAHFTSQGTMATTFEGMSNVVLTNGGTTAASLQNGTKECITFSYSDSLGAATTVVADAQGILVETGADSVDVAEIVAAAAIPDDPLTVGIDESVPAVVGVAGSAADSVCSAVNAKVLTLIKNHKFGGTGVVN